MMDDYQLLCKQSKVMGAFDAYKLYTMKYSELFDCVFKGLYMTDIDNLKGMISDVDFENNLKIALDNKRQGILTEIIKETEKVVSMLNFHKDFDLYLGLELGNIGGFSAPNPKGKPFVYIGIDRILDKSFIKYFIPHELNHMVRINELKEINLLDFSERVISEGLGSFCPIKLYEMDYSIDTIASTLGLPQDEVRRLDLYKYSLRSKIVKEFGKPLTKEHMSKYFTWSDGDEGPLLSGYYIGMEIIKQLVEAGYDFAKLTVMPAELVIKEFTSLFNK